MTTQGPRWVVSVGEKTIDYSESFRMFLATRSPAPCVPPDVASLITVVNFSVTLSGLEGRLLGLTIEHEQPDLERTKTTLLAAEDELKIELEAMEVRRIFKSHQYFLSIPGESSMSTDSDHHSRTFLIWQPTATPAPSLFGRRGCSASSPRRRGTFSRTRR